MVNYDLPWNPNRIEQRFGRIHRIGQREVCRLWNLVAVDTREGEVYARLLAKVEEQRQAYGGRVFDVLGQAFESRPLRDLLMDAVRYGDDPQRQADLDRIIDHDVAAGLQELLSKEALAHEMLGDTDLVELRRQMDEARARRLQPHYIELFFRTAFTRLGGRLARREKGRYEIAAVPASLRQRDPRMARRAPIARSYERVAFDPAYARPDGLVPADVVAPGHPLFDVVVEATLERNGALLARGTVLVDARPEAPDEPRLLVAVAEEVVNGRGEAVARRFGYVTVTPRGTAGNAGSAPYLDLEPLPDDYGIDLATFDWLPGVEAAATRWILEHDLPAYARTARERISSDAARTRAAVTTRLRAEINRLYSAAGKADEDEAAGRKVRVRASTLVHRAEALDARLNDRLRELDLEGEVSVKPPHVAGVALVVPKSSIVGSAPVHERPPRVVETKEVERRAVDLVLALERSLGRQPEEMPPNNPGYDIRSLEPDGHLVFLEVKGRIAGSEDFFVTYNELLHAKNTAPRYRLALVSVSPDGPDRDEVRYVADPFARTELGDFQATGVRGSWAGTWARGTHPF